MTTYLGKSCSFCLPRVPFVNCRQCMYLVISLLVLRAGYGIWLYQFLIIAYLFTFYQGWRIKATTCLSLSVCSKLTVANIINGVFSILCITIETIFRVNSCAVYVLILCHIFTQFFTLIVRQTLTCPMYLIFTVITVYSIRIHFTQVPSRGYHELPELTGANRNGPAKIPKRTSMGTEKDRNGLQWIPKRTGTDFRSYRNELQWEPEKVGWGMIGTILIKLCMYG